MPEISELIASASSKAQASLRRRAGSPESLLPAKQRKDVDEDSGQDLDTRPRLKTSAREFE